VLLDFHYHLHSITCAVLVSLSPLSLPTVLKLEGLDLAGIILILMAQNLLNRILKFGLEAEKIKLKVI